MLKRYQKTSAVDQDDTAQFRPLSRSKRKQPKPVQDELQGTGGKPITEAEYWAWIDPNYKSKSKPKQRSANEQRTKAEYLDEGWITVPILVVDPDDPGWWTPADDAYKAGFIVRYLISHMPDLWYAICKINAEHKQKVGLHLRDGPLQKRVQDKDVRGQLAASMLYAYPVDCLRGLVKQVVDATIKYTSSDFSPKLDPRNRTPEKITAEARLDFFHASIRYGTLFLQDDIELQFDDPIEAPKFNWLIHDPDISIRSATIYRVVDEWGDERWKARISYKRGQPKTAKVKVSDKPARYEFLLKIAPFVAQASVAWLPTEELRIRFAPDQNLHFVAEAIKSYGIEWKERKFNGKTTRGYLISDLRHLIRLYYPKEFNAAVEAEAKAKAAKSVAIAKPVECEGKVEPAAEPVAKSDEEWWPPVKSYMYTPDPESMEEGDSFDYVHRVTGIAYTATKIGGRFCHRPRAPRTHFYTYDDGDDGDGNWG